MGQLPMAASSYSQVWSNARIIACICTPLSSHTGWTSGGRMPSRRQALQTAYSPVRYLGQSIRLELAADQVENFREPG